MYSESEDAKRLYQYGFDNGHYRYSEALAVAKHMRHVLGYGDARIRSSLIEFCKTHDPFFREIPRRSTILRIVRNSVKDFRETKEKIILLESELNSVRVIKNFKFQKILVGMMALCKLHKRDVFWINEWKFIRKIISPYIKNKDIWNCMAEAFHKGLVDEPKADYHHLTFFDLNNTSYDGESKSIELNNDRDFINLSRLYEEYCGGVLGYCRECGKEFIKQGKAHVLCDVHKQKAILRKHSRYNKKR